MKSDFYRYIVKSKNYYQILKDNKYWGSYRRLSDALYERDRFMQCNWVWDDVLELEDTENKYEHMDLPPFQRDYSYVYEIPCHYRVFKGGEYLGYFTEKTDADEYAEEVGGRVICTDVRFRIQKSINGKTIRFGCFDNIEDALERRDELIKNEWKK